MQVLKILAVVFGGLLLLTGATLIAVSAFSDTGQTAFDEEIARSGYTGPVEGTVISVEQGTLITASYTDTAGTPHTGQGVATTDTMPAVGDTITLYYSTTDPDSFVVLDIPGGSVSAIFDKLRTAGIITLIVGALLLLAGILGLVFDRKRSAVAGGPGGAMAPSPYPPQAYMTPPPAGQQQYGGEWYQPVPGTPPYGSQPPGMPQYGPPPNQPPYGPPQPGSPAPDAGHQAPPAGYQPPSDQPPFGPPPAR